MTNNPRAMDFDFVGTTPPSPWQSLFCSPTSSESTSEDLSPDPPKSNRQIWSNSSPTQYILNYDASLANLYPNERSDEHSRSSTLDEGDRRMAWSGSASTLPKNKESTTNMHLRRRAQNRASQRAFRERKEKHLKGVEHQLEILHEKHQVLLQSYSRQSDEVSRLSNKIWELTTEVNSLQSSPDKSTSKVPMLDQFDSFDAFSTPDMIYDETGCYFGKDFVDLDLGSALHASDDFL